ncbi:MAG: proline dehydrogenase family protein [Vicinamibacteraceae bacterium]|nr:proline dehydrogenase family protein [Vicinamibacteraceae bacterium]
MLQTLSKSFFHTLAGNGAIRRVASRYGMRTDQSFARRFVAGETIGEAIRAARDVEARGMTQTLDQLGESVTSADAAAQATRNYLALVEAIAQAGIGRNISVKLTQLGLDIDRATSVDNLRRILDAAQTHGFFVRIDMENSPYTDATLDIVDTVWDLGFRNVGTVLQSALRRSEQDLERLIARGIRVRLVKGAYNEPRTVAYADKADVDACFLRMARRLLDAGDYPAIATHDVAMIEATRRYADEKALGRERYEFQMLFGIRRDLQQQLVREGYGMRIYIPFGTEWFAYFMRRLGERPANVWWVLKGVVGEKS